MSVQYHLPPNKFFFFFSRLPWANHLGKQCGSHWKKHLCVKSLSSSFPFFQSGPHMYLTMQFPVRKCDNRLKIYLYLFHFKMQPFTNSFHLYVLYYSPLRCMRCHHFIDIFFRFRIIKLSKTEVYFHLEDRYVNNWL